MANNSMDTIAEDEETSGPMPSMPSGYVVTLAQPLSV